MEAGAPRHRSACRALALLTLVTALLALLPTPLPRLQADRLNPAGLPLLVPSAFHAGDELVAVASAPAPAAARGLHHIRPLTSAHTPLPRPRTSRPSPGTLSPKDQEPSGLSAPLKLVPASLIGTWPDPPASPLPCGSRLAGSMRHPSAPRLAAGRDGYMEAGRPLLNRSCSTSSDNILRTPPLIGRGS